MTERRTALRLRRSDAQGRPSNACLVVLRGQHLGHRIDIGEQPVVLGRSAECDFQISDRSVSRQHAQIWRTATGCRLKDLGSTNHTLLNDADVDEAVLLDGDLVTVGGSVLKFMESSSVEARYHDEIYQLATIDPLTDLANRRHFFELAERESATASSSGRLPALLVIDLDYFKAVNDLHGHPAGDAVLKAVAATLRANISEPALAARIGGEEFAVLLPETTLESALKIAEQLRVGIAGVELGAEAGVKQVTVSIGVAAWTPDMKIFTDLMRVADAQLYVAKQGGRNRVSAEVPQ